MRKFEGNFLWKHAKFSNITSRKDPIFVIANIETYQLPKEHFKIALQELLDN